MLGWYLAFTEIVHLLLNPSFLVTDIIVYGTFTVASRITRVSVFSGTDHTPHVLSDVNEPD